MLVGAGGNITVQVGSDGVLLVDTQYAPLSNKILAAIRTLSQGPLRYIINTHSHPRSRRRQRDAQQGRRDDCRRQRVAAISATPRKGAQIIAHINAYKHMSARVNGQFATPPAAWPTEHVHRRRQEAATSTARASTSSTSRRRTPTATASCSSGKSDVISAGDMFVTDGYPFIDLACRRQRSRHRRRAQQASSTCAFRSTARKAARWSFPATAACRTSAT